MEVGPWCRMHDLTMLLPNARDRGYIVLGGDVSLEQEEILDFTEKSAFVRFVSSRAAGLASNGNSSDRHHRSARSDAAGLQESCVLQDHSAVGHG